MNPELRTQVRATNRAGPSQIPWTAPCWTAGTRSTSRPAFLDHHLAEFEAGLLDHEGVKAIFDLHDHPHALASAKVQLDAAFNYLLGVQILYRLGDRGRTETRATARRGVGLVCLKKQSGDRAAVP